jgi:hypothetical protein
MQMFKCEEVKIVSNQSKGWRKPSRIYIWPKGETIMDNLNNRRQRPYTVYRKEVLPGVLASLGIKIEDAQLRWSRYAGCSCPCSPGFILDGYYSELNGKDILVTLVEA